MPSPKGRLSGYLWFYRSSRDELLGDHLAAKLGEGEKIGEITEDT